MYNKICSHCGECFESKSSSRKYCGNRCRKLSKLTLAICKECGELIICYKSRVRQYCNKNCRYKSSNTKEYTCKECGKIFRYNKEVNRIYCSNECCHKASYEIKQCPICNKEFESRVVNDQITCSPKCGHKYRSINRRKEINCLHCNKIVSVKKKSKRQFCNIDCLLEYQRKEFVCPNCGRIFKEIKSHRSKTCSVECQHEYYVGKRSAKYKGNYKNLIRAIRFSRWYKKLRTERFIKDDRKSFLSGFDKEIQHHHIDSISYLVEKHNITMDNVWEFKEILFDINNVVTMTKEEHAKLHKIYGVKTTSENFQEFEQNFENLMKNC